MNPPQEFVATPPPPAMNFKLKQKPFPSGIGASIIGLITGYMFSKGCNIIAIQFTKVLMLTILNL